MRAALRVSALSLLALAVGTGGCSSPTGVVVAIYSDLPASQLARVVLEADTAGSTYDTSDQPWLVGPGQPDHLPGSIILLWGTTLDPMSIKVSGYGPMGAMPLVVRKAQVTPVPGQLQLLRVALTAACVGPRAPKCPGDQTCIDGQCAPGPVDAACLVPYQSGDEASVACQGSTQLLDSSDGTPVPVSGPGCASTQTCIEGCCVGPAGSDGGPDALGPPDGPPTSDAPGMGPDLPLLPPIVIVGQNRGDTLPGPVDDTWIRESETDEGNDTDGTLQISASQGDRREALIRFHLDALAGRQVTEAHLLLAVTRASDNVRMHRLLQAWDNNASWSAATNNADWDVPGCADTPNSCRQDPEISTVNLHLGAAQINVPVDVVQDWIDHPERNQGLLFRFDSDVTPDGDARITSSDGNDGTRPRLFITLRP
jgi:hypothetical protein